MALALVAAPLTAGPGIWTSGGPEGGDITALAVDPSAVGRVFAGTRRAGVFRSTDSGSSWSQASAGLIGPIGDLVAASDGTLYAIAEAGSAGVFRSIDSGDTWTEVLAEAATALAVDPADPAAVFVGTGELGVFKTVDAGDSWTSSASGLSEVSVLALAVAPGGAGTVFAGSAAEGVYKSVDAGVTWAPSNAGADDLRIDHLVVDPSAPSTVYAGTLLGGVVKTVDGGATWSEAISGLASGPIGALALAPTSPSTLFAGVGARLFQTVNGGAGWTERTLPVVGVPMQALAVDPSSALTVYAATAAGVARSLDGGTVWAEINAGLRAVLVDRIVYDPSAPGVLFASSPASGVYKSTDGGASWLGASVGLSDRAIADLALAASQPSALLAGTRTELFRSADGGASWSPAAADPADFGAFGPVVTAVNIDPADAAVRYAGERGFPVVGLGAGLYGSIDGGTTWSQIFDPGAPLTLFEPRRFAIRGSDPDRLFVASRTSTGFFGLPIDYSVVRSQDGGVTWQEVLAGADRTTVDLALDPLASQALYASASGDAGVDLLRSANGGATWSPLAPPAPCVHSLEADRLTPGTVYLGCAAVYRSQDSGATWALFDGSGLPALLGGVYELTQAPTLPAATLHAGTAMGVYSYGLPLPADLAITKDDGVSELDPGDSLTYTLTVLNLGPSDVVGATVTDELPGEVTCTWVCAASGGASCDPSPPAGDLDEAVDLPAGDSVVFTGSCVVSSGAGGFLVNTAEVAVPAGFVDPVPGNEVAVDTDVVLEIGACGVANDRILSEVDLAVPQTIEACQSITLQKDVGVSADVVLRAPVVRIHELAVIGGSLAVFAEVP